MPTIRMTIKGLKEIQQGIKKKLDVETYAQAMHKALVEGKNKSKELCPVRTGFMRQMIHFKRVGKLAFKFTCDCAYASFNEWGWYGIPNVGTDDAPVHYKGGFRPFMRPGMILARHRMKKYVTLIMIKSRYY